MPLLRSFLSKGPFPNFAVKGLTVLFILQAVVLYLQVQFRTKTSLLERDWVGECERHNKAQQALATIHENPGKSLVQNRRLSKASGGSAALFVEVPIEELGNQIKEIHLKIRDISLRQNCIGNRVLKRTRQCFQLKESLDKKDQLYCASEAQFFAPGRGSRSKLGDVSTIPKRLINQLPTYGNCPDEIYMHQNIQYTGGGGGGGGGGPGLGLCAATHADGPYLAEWLAFHRIQGFTHFVLYSLSNKKNKINSTRIYAKVLKDIKSTEKISEAVAAWGDGVTLVGPEEVPGVDPEAAAAADGGGAGAAPGLWAALLADCRHRLGNQSVEWAAWLGGAHEFLFPLDPEGEGGQTVASTITNLVSSETNHLGAIRFEYGSNFHTKRPASWHIKRYDLTTQMFFSRSRLDPNSTNSGGVVMARLSSLGAPPPAPWAAPPHGGGGGAEERGVVPAVFRVNRYTRSLQDLDYKAQTFFWEHQDGSSRKKFTSRVQSDAFYNFIERDRNEVVDPAAARYGCALRVALARACAAPWPALLPAKRDSRREPPSTWAADTSRWVALHSHVHEYLMQAKNIKKKCDANDQRGGAMKEISNYIENNLSSVVGEDDAENTKKDQADDDAAELSYDDDYHAEAEDYNTEEDNEEQTDDQEWDFQEEEEEEEEISTSRATTDKYNPEEEEENQEATTTSPY